MTKKLEKFVSSAEYTIVHYLKEHDGCTKRKMMPQVIDQISIRENKEGEIIHDPKPIHTLTFLIAIKELEVEGVLKIDRGDVPFPSTDFKTRFSLAKH